MRFVVLTLPGALGAGLVDLERQYGLKIRECEKYRAVVEFSRPHGWCPPEQFSVLESASPIHRGALIGSGGTGLVFESTDGRFVLKIPKSDVPLTYMKGVLCRERTMYDFVHEVGATDLFPRRYHPTPDSVSEPCLPYLVVTDKVGPYDLSDLYTSVGNVLSTNKKELVRIGIRLVQIAQTLFSIHVSHKDLNDHNIMFSDPADIAGSMKLIDLGLSRLRREVHHTEYMVDLIAVLDRLVELSTDQYRRADDDIVRIRDRIGEHVYSESYVLEDSLFDNVIDLLNAIDTPARPEPVIGTIMESVEDYESMKWVQVARVRKALERKTGLEAHLERTMQRRRIFSEDFQNFLRNGVKISGESISFNAGSHKSVDGRFEYRIALSWEIEEHLRQKRLDMIFRENGIMAFTDIPDGWIEGENLLVDAITFSESRVPLKDTNRCVWIREESVHVTAARIAITLIELLEKIHNLGLVHGQISQENIFGRINHDTGKVELDTLVIESAGWGRMFVSDEGFVLPQDLKDCKRSSLLSGEDSPAQIMGFCPGRFDDLYRLSETLYQFITGQGKTYGFSHTEQSLMLMKKTWTVQDAPAVFTDFHHSMYVSSLERDTSRPDYAGWIRRFQTLS